MQESYVTKNGFVVDNFCNYCVIIFLGILVPFAFLRWGRQVHHMFADQITFFPRKSEQHIESNEFFWIRWVNRFEYGVYLI